MREQGHQRYSAESYEGGKEEDIHKSSSFLDKVRAHGRMLSLMIAGVSAIGVHPGEPVLKRVEPHYKNQYERLGNLEDREKKLEELYGKYFDVTSDWYRMRLEEERMALITEGGLRKRYVDINKPRDLHETERTGKTRVGEIKTRDGIIDKETLSDILTETYPKGWVHNEISEISMVKENVNVDPNQYGAELTDASNWVTIASCKRGKKDEITFFRAARRFSSDEIQETLAHEIGHANDWVSDNEMNAVERADLALAIADRLFSSDRFRSYYVEAISNRDKKEELYTKAKEYWAVIFAQYMQNPEELHVNDFTLVDERVKAADHNFNWKQARTRQGQLIKKTFKTQKHAARR